MSFIATNALQERKLVPAQVPVIKYFKTCLDISHMSQELIAVEIDKISLILIQL
jgi:hypothetical protein